MEDSLFLNTKLYGGFKGIIGRRDYFLNCIKICSINLVFTFPYIAWTLNKLGEPDLVFNPLKCFIASPIFIKIWFVLGVIITCILAISNVFRRINDIQGSINKIFPSIVSLFCIIASFSFLLPNFTGFIFVFINIVLSLFILFKRGKITSKYPYDFTKEFNWGAFLGSWIWGLVNKSYITLLSFIVAPTPWGMYFALYCGLKGNEWAYKNKKWNNVEEFNKEQEKQTTIFAILFGVIIPVLYFICVFGFIILMFSILSQPPKAGEHSMDTKAQAIEYRLDNILTNSAKIYFESYKIEALENKFYINEKDWKSYDFTKRKDILDLAAQVSANDKEKMSKKDNGYKEYYSKSSELNKTKIYGAKTHKLLAEFKINLEPDMKFTDIIKQSVSAYRFYEP